MQPQRDNPVPVILVGRSPVERSLRRDPSIEMVRAPGMLNAIGELASLSLETSPDPVVVFASEAQESGDLARCIESLRVVDARVRIVGVRARDNGTPAPSPSPHIPCWIDDDATGDDLRASLTPAGEPIDESPQRRDADQGSTPSPTPTKDLPIIATDDRSIIELALRGGDVANACLALLRNRLGEPEIELILSDEAPEAALSRAVCPVVHAEHRFAWLMGPASRRTDLDEAAPWLASWLALSKQQAQLRSAALTDPLTGAWNRRYFDRYLRLAIERAKARRHDVSLLLFDLDDFKTYNDRYGHGAGDEILRETVRLLTSIIRPTDRVARVGGDEFAVIFDSPEGPRDPSVRQPLRIYDLAQRFRKQIHTHRFPKLGEEARGGALSISGGLATFPWDAPDAETLVERADRLILSSKAQGKNLICIGEGEQLASDWPDLSDSEQSDEAGEK